MSRKSQINQGLVATVPTGGMTGQVLKKKTNADNDVEWGANGSVPTGGTQGQVLTKRSSTDGDADWENVNAIPAGGTTGQVLSKHSNTSGDVEWADAAASITVDSAISASSENPVQNKVIKSALDDKADLVSGKIPSSQLPSYVDDVVEGYYKSDNGKFYEDASYTTEITGETGKIYLSLDTNYEYRWSGSAFVRVNEGVVLGETSSTAFRGDHGKTAYDDSQLNKTAIGTLSNLSTTAKSDLVSAVNEVDNNIIELTQAQYDALTPAQKNNGSVYYINDAVYKKNYKGVCGYTPVGTIIAMSGSCPANYHECDGSILNIADYPELANYYSVSFDGEINHYGGDGITTFAVPDLRGEFIRGSGTNSHTDQGSGGDVGDHQDGTLHAYSYINANNKQMIQLTNNVMTDFASTFDNLGTSIERLYGGSFTGTDMNGNSFTSRPTNTSVLFCVAVRDIFIYTVPVENAYSTTENVVGEWIDGKPIYQKTYTNVAIQDAVGQSTIISNAQLPANIDDVVEIKGMLFISSAEVYPLPISWGGSYMCSIRYHKSNGIMVNVDGWSGSGKKADVTIQYTKTTD